MPSNDFIREQQLVLARDPTKLAQARENMRLHMERLHAVAQEERKRLDARNAARARADDAEINSGRTRVDIPPPMPAPAGAVSGPGPTSIAGQIAAFQASL
jgi:hypothetical protein